MAKTACFIPIKAISKRVKGKNFRPLCGMPLYQYIIYNAIKSKSFDVIYIDTDSSEVIDYCTKLSGVELINRKKELAQDDANGNDLLNYHYSLFPDYDYYFQLFATAPFLRGDTISKCVKALVDNVEYDSVLTASKECGWFWFYGTPINYDPKILPRSQDAMAVVKETTGLYGITNQSLKDNKCRIGINPFFFYLDEVQSLDIDTEFDFEFAQKIMEKVRC